jgi:hypothetical protein
MRYKDYPFRSCPLQPPLYGVSVVIAVMAHSRSRLKSVCV